MDQENNLKTVDEVKLKARRKFLKSAAGVAVTAPAVTLLVSAPTKSYAGFVCLYGEVCDPPT